jgi:endonuclease G
MDLERLKAFIRTREVMEYLDEPNISSVGIGYKIKGGKRRRAISIQFTVDQKVDIDEEPEALEAMDTRRIPPSFEVEGEIINTDVIERCYEPSFEVVPESVKPFRKRRADPVVPGISVCNVEGSAGTVGCSAYDSKSGEPYVLSNWHVLHGRGGEIGDLIVQPGPFDDANTDENELGSLVRSHLGLAGDCAIASITDRDMSPRIHGLETVPLRIAEVELDDQVVKSGRTTGVTHGIVTRINVTINLNYGGQVGQRKIGGFEIGPDPNHPAPDNEISMGGDSGSVWVVVGGDGQPTDIVAGLHFAGESKHNPDEYALACNIHSVLRNLEVSLTAPEAVALADPEVVPRTGYDEDFLGDHSVEFPWLVGDSANQALEVDGATVIDYHHFSLAMHRQRRMAIFAAHNIDGLRMKSVSRSGIDWRFDSRFDRALQVGNEAYVDNPWDRGHLVRRAAVVWGSLAAARRANRDSFHYTNGAPQHRNFNRDEWVHLEDWVLDGADENNYRACVFTGPVFTPQDELYRGIRIPAGFWKVIATPRGPQQTLSVVAFLMNQYEFLHDSDGRRFLNLHVYQVSVETIEDLAQLEFTDEVRQAQPQTILETLVVPEGLEPEPWSLVSSAQDIVF